MKVTGRLQTSPKPLLAFSPVLSNKSGACIFPPRGAKLNATCQIQTATRNTGKPGGQGLRLPPLMRRRPRQTDWAETDCLVARRADSTHRAFDQSQDFLGLGLHPRRTICEPWGPFTRLPPSQEEGVRKNCPLCFQIFLREHSPMVTRTLGSALPPGRQANPYYRRGSPRICRFAWSASQAWQCWPAEHPRPPRSRLVATYCLVFLHT